MYSHSPRYRHYSSNCMFCCLFATSKPNNEVGARLSYVTPPLPDGWYNRKTNPRINPSTCIVFKWFKFLVSHAQQLRHDRMISYTIRHRQHGAIEACIWQPLLLDDPNTISIIRFNVHSSYTCEYDCEINMYNHDFQDLNLNLQVSIIVGIWSIFLGIDHFVRDRGKYHICTVPSIWFENRFLKFYCKFYL